MCVVCVCVCGGGGTRDSLHIPATHVVQKCMKAAKKLKGEGGFCWFRARSCGGTFCCVGLLQVSMRANATELESGGADFVPTLRLISPSCRSLRALSQLTCTGSWWCGGVRGCSRSDRFTQTDLSGLEI